MPFPASILKMAANEARAPREDRWQNGLVEAFEVGEACGASLAWLGANMTPWFRRSDAKLPDSTENQV